MILGLSEQLVFLEPGDDSITEEDTAAWVWRKERHGSRLHASSGSTAVLSAMCQAAWGERRGANFGVDSPSPGFLICQMEIMTAPDRVGLGLSGMTPGTYLMKGSDPKNGSNYYWVPVFSINYCIEFDLRNNPML